MKLNKLLMKIKLIPLKKQLNYYLIIYILVLKNSIVYLKIRINEKENVIH